MAQSFLIMLREGMEAALIVAIVLGYLSRTGRREFFGQVWLGVLGAVLLSLAAGAFLFIAVGGLEGSAEEVFEGLAMLTAVFMLTWMIGWMKRQSATIRRSLEAEVNTTLHGGAKWGLAALALVAVGREGLESVLFMFAAVTATSPGESLFGGTIGLLGAVIIGYAIYAGSHLINLRIFFNLSGILLIIIAGGLLAHGLHELQEAGLIPAIVEEVWNIKHILNDKEGVGSLLKGIFGYNDHPSLVEVMAYVGYIFIALWYFIRPPRLVSRSTGS